MERLRKTALTSTGNSTNKLLCIAILMLVTAVGCEKYEQTHIEEPKPTTISDYSLDGSGCSWNYEKMAQDSVYVINSQTELMRFITGANPPTVDFTQHSVLVVHGKTIYGSIANITPKFVSLLQNEYKLTIEIQLSDTNAPQEWHIAVVTSKKMEQNTVPLNIYYPHIEVWKCFFEGWLLYPDITITLTLDTLLSRFNVRTIPQGPLGFIYDGFRYSFLFVDSTAGKYLMEEDTMFFNGYFLDDFYPYNSSFTRTMYLQDSMLLHHEELPHNPAHFYILDYLFIKQN